MAKVVGQSTALAALKKATKGAWESGARDVQAKPGGFVNIPGGVQCISRIVGAELGMSKDRGKGSSPQISLKFIVREPVTYDGVQQTKNYTLREKTEGKRKKSVSDILAEFSNDIQLLGIETAGTSEDDIPALLEQLATEKPYFRSSTWEFQLPDTMMYGHNIIGKCDYTPSTPEPEYTESEHEPEAQPEPEQTPQPEGTEDDWQPAVRDHYYCELPGSGRVVVVVTAVQEDAKTVSIQEKDSAKKWTKVAWSKLQGE